MSRSKKLLPVIIMLFWFAQYIYIPFQTPYLTGIGTTAALTGIIVGMYGAAQVLLRLPAGAAADRVGRHKPFILAGGLLAGAASLFRVVMDGSTGYLIANVLSGAGSAMWISFMVCYTGFYPEAAQQHATARAVLFNNAGILAGFAAGTALYNIAGMRMLCILSCAAGFTAALLALFLEPDTPDLCRMRLSDQLRVCRNPDVWFYAIIAVVQQGVQAATAMSFTPQILNSLGADSLSTGAACIFYMLCAVGFSLFAGSNVAAKLGPKLCMVIPFIGQVIYCVTVPQIHSVPAIIALQILPGLSSGLLFSVLTSQAMHGVAKFQRSTAMGLYQAVYALGITLFPMMTGAIAGAVNITLAYAMLAALSAGAAVLVMFKRDAFGRQ